MPVDAIQPYQIIIMVAFLLPVDGGGVHCPPLSRGIVQTYSSRETHALIEDMALTPHQRLHLIEVDGQTFMIHSGKGHAATVVVVNGTGGTGCRRANDAYGHSKPTQKPASPKSQKSSEPPATRLAGVHRHR